MVEKDYEGFDPEEMFGGDPQKDEKVQAAYRLMVRRAMDVPEVRQWVRELLRWCGIYHHGFSTSSWRDFNAGMRNVGLKIMGDIGQACRDEKFMGRLVLDLVAPKEVKRDER